MAQAYKSRTPFDTNNVRELCSPRTLFVIRGGLSSSGQPILPLRKEKLQVHDRALRSRGDGLPGETAGHPRRHPRRRRLVLLDSTITNIAAPTVARDLHGGEAVVQWLGASYALALGVLLVVGGRLGDKYGRRRLFMIGITGFTLASIACGLTFSPESIIIARLVQGAFGALLIPQGFGILESVFPRDQIGKAFSAFAPTMGLSAVGGPILAGFLIDADLFGLGWRSMFLINIVLGGAAILAARPLRSTASARGCWPPPCSGCCTA
jgi:hypothetical protein